jgi:benzoyl-CoA reductase/2-hydroxyglutaryl-CoA dehydratase subunit BcrC/BadD/HgdB
MSKQNETGNAKNVANLQKLIEQVSVYTGYNPSVEKLTIESLNTLYTNALASVTEVEEKRNANKNAIHTRQQAYTNLKPITTRIINQLDILGLTKGVLDRAKSLNYLIQGNAKKKKVINEETGEEKNTVSTSRQSYTQLADNFSKLLQLLSTIPSYNPNIEELKLVNLNTYLTSLINSTKGVDQTEAELNEKLIERDNVLYADGTGLYTIAQNVKKYIKSLFGATSPEYSKVAKIKFTTN